MTKHLVYLTLLWMTLFYYSHSIQGQSKIDTIVLNKGSVLDILLLDQNPDVEADLKSYFKTAFPIAKRMSYQPLPGFKIVKHTQGNLCPQALILGKWESKNIREAFLTQILEEVPDFHERRRKIWSYFGLRYFEIPEDVYLKIDRSKYQVATAFWFASKDDLSEFYTP